MEANRRDEKTDYDPLMAYDSRGNEGDIAMHNMQNGLSETESTEYVTTKNGVYTSLNVPSSPPSDLEAGDHSRRRQLAKRYDRHRTSIQLLKTGGIKLIITIFFSALLCLVLKSWAGWKDPIPLSKKNVRLFNASTIGISLCLGLNLLSSLSQYASVFRWTFLTRRYMSLEVFDLIMHLTSLTSVAKLMIISAPGFRNRKALRKFKFFRHVRGDGTKWMWLGCLLWLTVNIGSQVLVALLSLFWPMANSDIPLLVQGNVMVANLDRWHSNATLTDLESSADLKATLESAWTFGMEAMMYPVFDAAKPVSQANLANLPGPPIYQGSGEYLYRFYNRDPDLQYANHIVSSRSITVKATCTQWEVRNSTYEDKDGIQQLKFEGRMTSNEDWMEVDLPEWNYGATTWTSGFYQDCGTRCADLAILQVVEAEQVGVDHTSLFSCTNTLSNVTKAEGPRDIKTHTEEDSLAVYGSDDFAFVAAGAIGWTGVFWGEEDSRQARSYSMGSKWAPAHPLTTKEVEDLVTRFTVGAIAAFDDHGYRYNVTNQNVRPVQAQQLEAEWEYIFGILGGICGLQLFALIMMIVFANRTVIRDDSYFSNAMLLSGVVGKIGESGMNMTGDEIKEHPKLKWKKIRYDYREGKNGEPNQVDIFFEGKDQREVRKSWATGAYT